LSKRPNTTFFIPGTQGIDFDASVNPLPEEAVIGKHFPNPSFLDRTPFQTERKACNEPCNLRGNEPYVYRHAQQGCKGSWIHL
jgi:hypothetical protein